MKKDFLNQLKATILSKEQLKTVTGTYGASTTCSSYAHCSCQTRLDSPNNLKCLSGSGNSQCGGTC